MRTAPPALPRLGALTDRALAPADVVDDLLLSGARVTDAYAEQAGCDFAEVTGVEFAGGALAGSQWYRARWVDVRMGGTDLANAVFTESGWERVAAEGVRATGLQLPRARLTDLGFTDGRLALLNVKGATLRRVRFTGCDLSDSQWADAGLTDVELVGCRLAGAELSAVGRLTRVRLVDCDLDGLSGLGRLRGATIRGADPVVLAQLFARDAGIVLEDG